MWPPTSERPAPPDGGNGPRKEDHAWRLISSINTSGRAAAQLAVTLHPPIRIEGVRFAAKWSVSFRGELIVEGSADPECDCARVLLARGFSGILAILDETTLPRTFVDIRRAALHRVSETGTYPKFRRVRGAESASSAEGRAS